MAISNFGRTAPATKTTSTSAKTTSTPAKSTATTRAPLTKHTSTHVVSSHPTTKKVVPTTKEVVPTTKTVVPTTKTEVIKPLVPGETQYVGSGLQYVTPDNIIQPVTSKPGYVPTPGDGSDGSTPPNDIKPPDKKTIDLNPDKSPVAGSIIGTRRGSKSGFRIDLIADGKGGYTESPDIADAGSQYGDQTVIPGPTGNTITTPDRTLAEDTFANTFALAFGKSEANQPYVKQLYKLVAGFYKSGSNTDESLNLALHEAKNNNAIPDFTKRFNGLFTLQAKAQTGQAVQVPTIAEFIHAENGMGDILRSAGMGDLATQDYLGQIIGQGKSVNDVANAITTSFNAIDNAPQDVKDTLSTQFPMLDRTTLAKSLLMGTDGTAEIQKKIDVATTATAAGKQNIKLTDAQSQLLATSGLS